MKEGHDEHGAVVRREEVGIRDVVWIRCEQACLADASECFILTHGSGQVTVCKGHLAIGSECILMPPSGSRSRHTTFGREVVPLRAD